MLKRLSFRQKVIFSQIVLFLLFIALSIPITEMTLKKIAFNSLSVGTSDLIEEIDQAANEQEMIALVQSSKANAFSYLVLYNASGHALYDSRGEAASLSAKELSALLEKHTAYSLEKLPASGKQVATVTTLFHFRGQNYIARTAFPYDQIQRFSSHFNRLFFLFCALALLFFSSLTWLIFNRLQQPIQQIIRAITPYQSGAQDELAEIVLSPYIDKNDDFYRLAQTLNSLSERIRHHIKNLTEERNEKEAILESLVEGVISVDSTMQVRYLNFIGSKMLGIPRRNLLGKSFPSTYDKASALLLTKCRELLIGCQEKATILTDSIVIGDARKIYYDLIAAPKSQRNGAIIVIQDKTTHYKVIEMGKDFVANASHELRTPITIIRGFAETLQDLPELPRDMLTDITEKIVRNCQRMDSLVKSLLTLADIENIPESRFQQCDLVPLVENCRVVVRSVYSDAEILIEKSHESILLDADPDILELAIINLLDNAAKYSPCPAHITVGLDQKDEEAVITIADRGMGIPQTDLEHIFERFYTVDKAHSRRLGGAGLGLSIVKTIIDKHEGKISVQSTIGKGTTFTIVLPLHHLRKG